MKRKDRQVKSRNEAYTQRPVTRIWQEQASEENPYVAASCRCFGYDLLALMEKRGFVDVFYLLFQGELPTSKQSEILETLMIALINPGPRHPATRAAMNAGVGKTDPAHILPIAMSILGGSHLGAGSIEEGIRFFRKQQKKDPELVAQEVLALAEPPKEGDWHPAPGFGTRFGGIDKLPFQIATRLAALPGAGNALIWGCSLADVLQAHGLGWLITGVASAVFSDLGFQPRAGAGLFQILSAPGLLAHGLELANKPITALPFPSDEDYTIEQE